MRPAFPSAAETFRSFAKLYSSGSFLAACHAWIHYRNQVVASGYQDQVIATNCLLTADLFSFLFTNFGLATTEKIFECIYEQDVLVLHQISSGNLVLQSVSPSVPTISPVEQDARSAFKVGIWDILILSGRSEQGKQLINSYGNCWKVNDRDKSKPRWFIESLPKDQQGKLAGTSKFPSTSWLAMQDDFHLTIEDINSYPRAWDWKNFAHHIKPSK